ncbi:hypothetical protein ACFFGH_02505 [Lysobacter korlensis]|uniref:Uncharacterized protein n=1 Tax=Lysobacter korlensis TaxID=553636 RepID=A0ABV6RIB0_9GAMM
MVPLGEYNFDLDRLDPRVAMDLGDQGYAVVRGEDWANLEVALQLAARGASVEAQPGGPQPCCVDQNAVGMALQQGSTLTAQVYEGRDGVLRLVGSNMRRPWVGAGDAPHYEVGEACLDLSALSGDLLDAIARQGHGAAHGRDRDAVLRSVTRWAEPRTPLVGRLLGSDDRGLKSTAKGPDDRSPPAATTGVPKPPEHAA